MLKSPSRNCIVWIYDTFDIRFGIKNGLQNIWSFWKYPKKQLSFNFLPNFTFACKISLKLSGWAALRMNGLKHIRRAILNHFHLHSDSKNRFNFLGDKSLIGVIFLKRRCGWMLTHWCSQWPKQPDNYDEILLHAKTHKDITNKFPFNIL